MTISGLNLNTDPEFCSTKQIQTLHHTLLFLYLLSLCLSVIPSISLSICHSLSASFHSLSSKGNWHLLLQYIHTLTASGLAFIHWQHLVSHSKWQQLLCCGGLTLVACYSWLRSPENWRWFFLTYWSSSMVTDFPPPLLCSMVVSCYIG